MKNIFKKKKSTIVDTAQKSITMTIEELPTAALELTYNDFQNQYKENNDGEIQKKLVILSKILTDRAYQQGNGHLEKEVLDTIPGLTKEKYRSMTENEKENTQRLAEKIKKLNKAAEELTKPTPEKIELELKAEIKVEEPDFFSAEHGDYEESQKKKKVVVVKKPVENQDDYLATLEEGELLEKKKILARGGEVKENELNIKKPKKSMLSFFKKKKKKQVQIPVTDDLVQTIDRIKEKQPEIFTTKVTPEQKDRASRMEIATRLKFGGLKKMKKEDPTKPSMKGLEEVYCMECKHSIKQHQKGGVDSGCSKCGCLTTIADIARSNEIKLHKPKEVLEKIEQQSVPEEEIISEDIIKVDDVVIPKKQIHQLKTMIKPKVVVKQKPVVRSIEEQMEDMDRDDKLDKYEEEHGSVDKSSPQLNTCTCDHIQAEHYNDNEFCQNKDCMCAEFKAYPK